MEKHRAIRSQIHSVIINQDGITDHNKIQKKTFYFYQFFFLRKVQNQSDELEAYLELIPLPKLTTLSCKGIISEAVFKSLKSMENN